jgi:hypothetical protein
MPNVATLTAKLTADDQMTPKLDAAGQAVDNLGAKSQGMSQKTAIGFGLLGAGLTAGVTAPVVDMAQMVFAAASDMNESMTKSDVVFGTSANAIQSWAETTTQSMGLSQAESLATATTFGNLFTTMGVGQPAAAALSKDIVGLAADISSFNNVPVDQVLGDLQSGLVGETEPLRKYGILLNESTVKQEAMALGLVDANGILSEQNKVLARNSLIMKQTTNAQGDFGRTSAGAANSTRILQAEMGDLASTIGAVLLPVGTDLIHLLIDAVSWFGNLSPVI